MVAKGIEMLNTKGLQLPLKASPGRPKKLILLTKVAKILIPTTHEGRLPSALVNAALLLRLLK